MKEKKINFISEKENTLLNVIKYKLKDLSNKTIKIYIKHKMVYVNNKLITNSSLIIKSGSNIEVYFTPKSIEDDVKLQIIYEDKDLIAINKPHGLLSISNDKEKERTAFRLVNDYLKKINPNNKLFVVHRLDEETSGVLLFSKNLKLKEELQDNWNNLVKVREYLAVVPGNMPPKGKIESYLTTNHFQIVHSTHNKEIGKYSITNFETIKSNEEYSLLRVLIDTGRRNQIRVHLSENYKPIVGDKKYGSTDNSINRLALHASKLVLIDPRTNKELTLEAKTPKPILSLVKNNR